MRWAGPECRKHRVVQSQRQRAPPSVSKISVIVRDTRVQYVDNTVDFLKKFLEHKLHRTRGGYKSNSSRLFEDFEGNL